MSKIQITTPDIARARLHPMEYQVTFSLCGTFLSEIGSECAMFIPLSVALELVGLIQTAIEKERSKRDALEEVLQTLRTVHGYLRTDVLYRHGVLIGDGKLGSKSASDVVEDMLKKHG